MKCSPLTGLRYTADENSFDERDSKENISYELERIIEKKTFCHLFLENDCGKSRMRRLENISTKRLSN
jgi:hypothetical protein